MIAKVTAWKHRSHDAYQGYSHLSGIETMSLFDKCCQSRSRPRFALIGRGRLRRVALEPAAHVEIIILLRPDHAGERLSLHELRVIARKIALQRGVEFIGLGDTRGEDRVEIGEWPQLAWRRPAEISGEASHWLPGASSSFT